jgi:O-acetylhomoserine (thiol)-lyase
MSYEAYKDKTLGFTTRQLHYGYEPQAHNGSKAVPIYQTAVFELGDYDRCVRLFDFSEEGHSYVRFSNPTNEVLEKRIASLEGGTAALSLASGMAAVCNTFLNLCSAGDEIIASPTLYGGSVALLSHILPDYGIIGRFPKDKDDIESYKELINEKTKAIFIESLGNPNMNIADIEALADLAHAHNIPLVVDNTFATPYLLRPFEHGADIVCYSATKYIGGHGAAIAGLVAESGNFDYLNGRFPEFEKFYAEYKGKIDDTLLKTEMFTRRLRYRYLTDMGAHMSPQTAFYILQGLETLSLRMERHTSNAMQIAKFLENHPKVESVCYPGLASSPYHSLAKKYFPKGPGAILSFNVKGGLEQARKLLESVRVFGFMVNVGDAKSLIVHPASSSHFALSKEEQIRADVYENTIRLSIGIEDVEDLIADLSQALDQI